MLLKNFKFEECKRNYLKKANNEIITTYIKVKPSRNAKRAIIAAETGSKRKVKLSFKDNLFLLIFVRTVDEYRGKYVHE